MICHARRLLGAACLLLPLLLGAAPASATPVLWNLVETSCFPGNNFSCKDGSAPIGLPLIIGRVGGTGSYNSDYTGAFSNSGTDFRAIFGLFVGPRSIGPASGPACPITVFYDCTVRVNLTDLGDGGVSGSIFWRSIDTVMDLTLSGLTFSGRMSSDGTLIGCGDDANCVIAGILTPVPEPPTAALVAAMLMLGAWFKYRRTHPGT